MKNDPQRPLPAYTGRVFQAARGAWRERPASQMKDRVDVVASKVRALHDAGLTGQLLIAFWLARGVVPLMSRQLHMWEMTLDLAPFAGTVAVPSPREPEEVEGMVRYLTGADFTLSAGRTMPLPLPSPMPVPSLLPHRCHPTVMLTVRRSDGS